MENKKYFKTKKGEMSILGVLVMGFLIIIVLSYFNISVKSIVESPTGQENVTYVKDTVRGIWTTYLAEPAEYLWRDVWINIFWKGFISNMERIRDGKPTDIDEAAQKVRI
ncbi:MAG: hypothetical protein WA060_02160 [Minisyncoccia bacterium]